MRQSKEDVSMAAKMLHIWNFYRVKHQIGIGLENHVYVGFAFTFII